MGICCLAAMVDVGNREVVLREKGEVTVEVRRWRAVES